VVDFNPYREWLGVEVEGRRPDHYELLGLRRFESDMDVVRSAVDAKTNTVRHVRPGAHLDVWQRLLDELSEARRCLTDPVQKQRYDERLRSAAATAASTPPPAVEQAAVGNPLPPSVATSSSVPTTPVSSVVSAGAASPAGAAVAAQPAAHTGYAPAIGMAPYPASAVGGYPMPNAAPPTPGTPPGYAPATPAGFPPLAMAIPVAPAQPPTSPPGAAVGMIPGVAFPPGAAAGMMPVGTVPTPVDPMAPVPGYVPNVFGGMGPMQYPAGVAPGGMLPMGSLAGGVSAVPVPTPSAAEEQLPGPTVSPSRRFFSRRRTQAGSLVAIAIVGLVVGLGLIMLLVDEARRRSAANQAQSTVAGNDTKTATNVEASGADTTAASRRGPNIVRRQPPEADSDPAPPKLTDDSPPDMPVKPEEKPEAQEPQPAKPNPEPEPKQPEPAAPMPKPEPKPPVPEPTPPPDPPKKPAPPVNEVAQMVAALNEGKIALGERRLDEAKAQIEIAGNLAKAANHKAMAHRMGLLHHYVVEFWKAVRESLKTANMIDELEVGTTRVAIVAASEESLTIRAAGQNRTYETMSLPAGVAMALATRWLDVKAPSTKIIRGAFHAVDPNGDPLQARRLWEEAKLLGGEVDELMPVLDDKFDVASLPATRTTPRQGPMPTIETITVAAKQVKEKYAKDIAAAKNKEQKYALVKKLVDDAGVEMPNESFRYALLAEARDQCTAAKFAQLLIQVVDEMERWFKIDTLTVKYESIAKAAALTTPGTARDFAIEALALTEKAIADKRYDVALKAAKVAHTTANRAKDRDLAVKAADKGREIGELTGKPAKPSAKTKPNGKTIPAAKSPPGKADEKPPFVKPAT
jgi:outer membrane biosynthesis protein TonB